MSDLTKSIQNCGLHDCNHNCYAITEKEASAAIDEVKKACIEAIEKLDDITAFHTFEGSTKIDLHEAIKAIESVK